MKESGFQFIRPYLQELIFSENQKFDFNEEHTNGVAMNNSFSVHVEKDSAKPMARVILTLEINKDEDDVPFKIKASIASLFRWGSEEEERINRMLKINAPALLLSYLRPIVAQITNSSKFPAYNIPFLNFTEEQME